MLYKIVRHYEDPKRPKRTVKSGLYLDEARAHCRDPESSSRTCVGARGKALTRRVGHWFDAYVEDVPRRRR